MHPPLLQSASKHTTAPAGAGSVANSFDDCRRPADYASQGALTLALVKVGPAPKPSWQTIPRTARELPDFSENSVAV